MACRCHNGAADPKSHARAVILRSNYLPLCKTSGMAILWQTGGYREVSRDRGGWLHGCTLNDALAARSV
jgi:hypothetical protein